MSNRVSRCAALQDEPERTAMLTSYRRHPEGKDVSGVDLTFLLMQKHKTTFTLQPEVIQIRLKIQSEQRRRDFKLVGGYFCKRLIANNHG